MSGLSFIILLKVFLIISPLQLVKSIATTFIGTNVYMAVSFIFIIIIVFFAVVFSFVFIKCLPQFFKNNFFLHLYIFSHLHIKSTSWLLRYARHYFLCKIEFLYLFYRLATISITKLLGCVVWLSLRSYINVQMGPGLIFTGILICRTWRYELTFTPYYQWALHIRTWPSSLTSNGGEIGAGRHINKQT